MDITRERLRQCILERLGVWPTKDIHEMLVVYCNDNVLGARWKLINNIDGIGIVKEVLYREGMDLFVYTNHVKWQVVLIHKGGA